MIRILPAIDIIDGKCVRLTKGDYNTKKVYDTEPLEMAKQYEDCGIEQIHIVDLDGAKSAHPVNLKIVESIKNKTSVKVEFGGGIKTDQAISDCNNAGVDQFIIGSLAVKDPDKVKKWISHKGADRFVIGADVSEGHIAINGWQEASEVKLDAFIYDYKEAGAIYFLCTDISKDGMLQGSSKELYKELITNSPTIKLIASGGVTSLEEVEELHSIGCDAAIIGKAIYENRISLEEMQQFISQS
jgi:phosphoribosylformimino-5-aminoimidazole carboxamide ribotide isomerase